MPEALFDLHSVSRPPLCVDGAASLATTAVKTWPGYSARQLRGLAA